MHPIQAPATASRCRCCRSDGVRIECVYWSVCAHVMDSCLRHSHSVIPAPAFTQRAQVLQDQMANMDKIVQKLRKIWKISANNHILPAAFSLICILGSFLKEQDLVPDSYFSNTKNVLNL